MKPNASITRMDQLERLLVDNEHVYFGDMRVVGTYVAHGEMCAIAVNEQDHVFRVKEIDGYLDFSEVE